MSDERRSETPPGTPGNSTTASVTIVQTECHHCGHEIETRIRGPSGSIRCRECRQTTRVAAESAKDEGCPWSTDSAEFVFDRSLQRAREQADRIRADEGDEADT